MIDYIHVKGCLGAVQTHYSQCFDHVTFSTFDAKRTKPTTTYLTSPLTGAQIELRPTIEYRQEGRILYAEFRIPVAASLIGQNCIHGGLSSLPLEMKLLSTLIRLLLIEQGFTKAESELFISSAIITMLELTWHVQTKNQSAANKRLRAAIEHLAAMEFVSSRHDIHVRKVDQWTSRGATSVLAHAKSDCSLRMYIKGEQMRGGGSGSKQGGFLAHDLRTQRDRILSAIEGQVRMEVLLGEVVLRRYGLDRPRRLQDASHLQLVKAICFALGEFRLAHLGDGEYQEFENAKDDLSQDNKQLLERYESGEDVLVALSDSKGTRTRQTLLSCGVDIALPTPLGLDPFQRSLSGQIAIEKMARFGRRAADLTVTTETSRRIGSSLLLMLRHARDDEYPSKIPPDLLSEWLTARDARLERARMVRRRRESSEFICDQVDA